MLKFKKLPWKIDNVFISSDLHLNHLNICSATSEWKGERGCRNFNSLEEMNSTIIDNINNKVGQNDLLIHLGDFSFQGEQNIPLFRNRIICKNIIAIRGNHDHHIHKYPNLFLEIHDLAYYQVGSIKLVCCHFPIFNWHEMNHDSIMTHGHLHGHEGEELSSYHSKYKILDCGIDNYYKLFKQYKPFSLREIINLTKDKGVVERH